MKKYKTLNHTKMKIRYHLIFSTKYRKNILNPIRDDIFKTMKLAEEKNKKFKIEIMEIDKNHIHFLLEISPSETISNVIKYLKQFSTYYLWHTKFDYMSNFYWKKHKLWTRGYFISTIGDCSEETLNEYIKNQG